MTKLYLHAGTHKTGTTAIQRFANKNRYALKERGILYPDYLPYDVEMHSGHHALAHSIAGLEKGPFQSSDIKSLLNAWKREADDLDLPILLSTEAIYRHGIGAGSYSSRRERFLSALSEALADFEVEVILVFRRPDDFVRSLYQENVSKMHKEIPDFSSYIEKEDRLTNYKLNLELFSLFFKNVTCFIYEDLISDGGVCKSLFSSLSVDIKGLTQPGKVRSSLTPVKTVLKNHANHFLESAAHNKLFMEWFKSSEMDSAIKNAMPNSSKYDLWSSHEQRAEYLGSKKHELAYLAEKVGKAKSDTLFPALTYDEDERRMPSIPKELFELVGEHAKYI